MCIVSQTCVPHTCSVIQDTCVVLCSDGKGKEIISRYTTTMETNQTWYTDANGREMKMRR